MPILNRILLVLLFSTSLFAHPSYFGASVPLTNTRYGTLSGKPLLTTNGSELFVFVTTQHNIRMARPGATVARPLLDASDGDAVWNGTHFLVAGSSRGAIVARLVDTSGEAAGAPFTIVAQGSKPRLAFDGESVVLLYENGGVHSLLLTRHGAPLGTPQLIAASARDYDAAGNMILLATTDGVKLGETLISDVQAHAVSLAADGVEGGGTSALAMWAHDGGVDAAVVSGGVAEPAFNLATDAAWPSVVWSNGAYHAAFLADDAIRIAQVNPAARGAVSAALAIQSASEQSLVATASTPNAALILWNENGDAHLGLRARGGAWRERVLSRRERGVAAASDGNTFVVITENEEGWTAAWLDEEGTLLQRSPRSDSFRARALAAANDAVVVGERERNVVFARVSRDGSISEPALLREGAEDPVIATDGTEFLVAWETDADAIEATRLDGNIIVVFEAGAEDPAVTFNGRDYVAVWRGGEFIRARRIGAGGLPVDEFVQISRATGATPHSIRLTRLGDTAGLTWFDGRSQLALIDFTSGWSVLAARGFDAQAGAAPQLVALPNQGLAFVQSVTNDLEPHHGSARVIISVAHAAPPSAPDAPQLTAARAAGGLRVSWTAPPQAVNGYRVEYRVDGGPWLEHDGWADAGTHEMLIEPRRSGTYQLRVRAFGDGGASAYSAPVEVTVTVGGRRRAVR